MGIAIGLTACAISSVFFGSMFVPVKKCASGNGIFVQWVMSTAILLVGVVVNWTQEFPEFEPLAMLGGAFWAIGNATAVPIMNTIGIGMGMLVWGTTNCVAGWAVGRFGLFETVATIPSWPLLNYFGLVLVVVGGFLFSQIKPTTSSTNLSERSPLMAQPDDDLGDLPEDNYVPRVNPDTETEAPPRLVHTPHRQQKRLLAIVVSLVAGVFYGFTFVPVIYIQNHREIYPTAPKDGLGYVFSHFLGIFVTASIIFISYLIWSRNNPYANSTLIGPSLLGGSMWGIAQTSWFVANDNLSQVVTFPIISMVPGVIAALWSVIYFRDIEGSRNIRILTVAVFITLIGAVSVGISK